MTTKKTIHERAAEAKAATERVRAERRRASGRLLVLTGESPTDPDVSASGLRARYNAGDLDVTALDVFVAEYERDTLLPAKLDTLAQRIRFLSSRELTLDVTLAEVVAPAVADALGSIPVEVALEVPERFNTSHAPRAYVVPFGGLKRDPHAGSLSGSVRVHYLRAAAHRSAVLDTTELAAGLDSHSVDLGNAPRFRGTDEHNGGALLLDTAHLDIRYAMPAVVSFARDHRPTQRDAQSFCDSIAYKAARATSAVGPRALVGEGSGSTGDIVRSVGRHVADDVKMTVETEGDTRRTVITVELAAVPRVLHPELSDAALAHAVLEIEVKRTVGTGVAGIGRVVEAAVTSTVGSFASAGRTGVTVRARFVLTSTITDAQAREAA